MPVIIHSRLVSDTSTNVANSREAAVLLALSNEPGNATIVPRSPLWPSLNRYTNDNTFNSSEPQPDYIWDSTISNGQTRGFAKAYLVAPTNTPAEIIVNLSAFSDNAHEVFIEVYRDNPFTLVKTLNPFLVPLEDGNMDPISGTTTDISPPYNWQSIRYFSNVTPLLPPVAPNNYILVVSFRVINYIPLGEPNPAGLAFVFDVYLSV